jgi:putative uncharacterized protein (fragment)
VLGYFRAGSRGDEHGRGGNIEGFRTVAACADDIDQPAFVCYGNGGSKFAHHGRGRSDFGNRFDFNPQAGQDGGNLFGRHLAAHDLTHQIGHFVVKQFIIANQAFDGLLRSNHSCSFLVMGCNRAVLPRIAARYRRWVGDATMSLAV